MTDTILSAVVLLLLALVYYAATIKAGLKRMEQRMNKRESKPPVSPGMGALEALIDNVNKLYR